MSFEDWWSQLTETEQKVLGFTNAKFVWQEGQKHGDFEVHIAGWVLTRGSRPGMIWISAAGGEGGDFHIHELAQAIGKFYGEKF